VTSFRPLLLFWACILGIACGGAIALQIMGPVPRPASQPTKTALPEQRPRAEPARLPPSTPHPAPPLKMTLDAIPAPDPALQEVAPGLGGRLLPRAESAARSPATLYAAAFDPAERHPRVTLVIAGMGLDRGLTAQANRTLPAAVDFAYSAYAPQADADRLAAEGRALGRECLLSIPMEPNGYPANEEGDRALLTGADPAQTRQNLDWALSATQGCAGATGASDGQGGERFAASTQVYGDVLTAVAQRGLVYLDPRPGARPPEDDGPGRRVPYVADILVDHAAALDQPADGGQIDRNLAQLEQISARRGSAIGIAGPPTPVLLDRIAVWSHGLASRGMVLTPLTANPPPAKTSTDAAR